MAPAFDSLSRPATILATVRNKLANEHSYAMPEDSVLFVGSSSVRMWREHIATGMAPHHPIERGLGGSRWHDVAVHADRPLQNRDGYAAIKTHLEAILDGA